MRVVCDIEANGLENPTKIWVIVCLDIDTDQLHIFREVSDNVQEAERFSLFAKEVTLWIGHNFLEYDYPVLHRLLGFDLGDVQDKVLDTLIISRMANYSRPGGHSIDAYGQFFGTAKLKNSYPDFFKQWSQGLEDYCVQDVEITRRVHALLSDYISRPEHTSAINLEQQFQLVVNQLHHTGFGFNRDRADRLLHRVVEELDELDKGILESFPPRPSLLREWTPKLTKHGTISRSSVPRGIEDLTAFSEDAPFCTFTWVPFNPSSHKQLIEVLNRAGWIPVEKTQTHIDFERELQRTRSQRNRTQRGAEGLSAELSADEIAARRDHFGKYGWKVNEANLGTLPARAPRPARLLAKRILLESRRRTLTEWLGLVQEDNRIHGRFYGIGAWTHRMSHQKPNVANIPNEFREDMSVKLLGKEMRQLWIAPKKRLLVGVDAEGIQLRIFAHLVNDPKLIDALVKGDKKLKTDPHSYNRGVLGDACKSRQAAKRFLYALFLGAGLKRLAGILQCSEEAATEALDRLLAAYPGFAFLKSTTIPADARRGYFIGLDGRRVPIPGDTVGERKHLCMSGYLQNGEAVIMKKATIKFHKYLGGEFDSQLVNLVHDEWQTETPNNMETAIRVASLQAESLRLVGEELNLNCPMAGSYWNDDHHDYTIGTNWYQTH